MEMENNIQFFKSSEIEQPQALKEYLEQHLQDPYNKHCADCKNNLSSSVVVWLGTYVCDECAEKHKQVLGGNQFCYVKNIFAEHWDDYQLRSIALGGNEKFIQLLREYGIMFESFQNIQSHPCVKWYRNKHLAQMNSIQFNQSKPPVDLEEKIDQIKKNLSISFDQKFNLMKENGAVASMNLKEKTQVLKEQIQQSQIFNKLKESSAQASAAASQQASKIQEKMKQSSMLNKLKESSAQASAAASEQALKLQEKIKGQEFSKNLFSMFGGNNSQKYFQQQQEDKNIQEVSIVQEDQENINPVLVTQESIDQPQNEFLNSDFNVEIEYALDKNEEQKL